MRILACGALILALAPALAAATDAAAPDSPSAAALSPAAAVSVSVAASVPSALSVTPEPSATPVFAPGETAAAYFVSEKLTGHINHVVGKNKSIGVELESKGDQRRVVVTVPGDGFKTNSGLRDGRVSGMLGGSKHPVEIRTAWFPAADLAGLAQGSHSLAGEIAVNGHLSAALTLTAQADGTSVRVDVPTSFQAVGMEPPALGPFGMLGEVYQPLTLSAQIQLDQVKGYTK